MLAYIIDYVFPRSNIDHSSIHTYLTEGDIDTQQEVIRYNSANSSWPRQLQAIWSASRYSSPLITDLIRRVKFQSETAICPDLAKLIHRKIWVTQEMFIPSPDIIIPVPYDNNRYIQRGFSLQHEIARNLSKAIKVEYCEIVKKIIPTDAQTTFQKKERLKNLDNAFGIYDSVEFPVKKDVAWIIDDVVTTGTTISEVARVVTKAYPHLQLYGITAASHLLS